MREGRAGSFLHRNLLPSSFLSVSRNRMYVTTRVSQPWHYRPRGCPEQHSWDSRPQASPRSGPGAASPPHARHCHAQGLGEECLLRDCDGELRVCPCLSPCLCLLLSTVKGVGRAGCLWPPLRPGLRSLPSAPSSVFRANTPDVPGCQATERTSTSVVLDSGCQAGTVAAEHKTTV